VLRLDRDGRGIDRLEFVVGMMQLLGVELCGEPLKWDDVRPFVKKFDELDVSATGTITRDDLDRFYREGGGAARRPKKRGAAASRPAADVTLGAVARLQPGPSADAEAQVQVI
jgi:hypothetical protein